MVPEILLIEQRSAGRELIVNMNYSVAGGDELNVRPRHL